MCCRKDCIKTGQKSWCWSAVKLFKTSEECEATSKVRNVREGLESQGNSKKEKKKKNQLSGSLFLCIWALGLKWKMRSQSKLYGFVQKSKKETQNINAIVIAMLKRRNIDHEKFHITWYWLVSIVSNGNNCSWAGSVYSSGSDWRLHSQGEVEEDRLIHRNKRKLRWPNSSFSCAG